MRRRRKEPLRPMNEAYVPEPATNGISIMHMVHRLPADCSTGAPLTKAIAERRCS